MRFEMRKLLLVALIIALFEFSPKSSCGQAVLHHISNEEVYEFLEEMSAIQLVDLNSVTLPLTRTKIHELLTRIDSTKLNTRQLKELRFFNQEFIKEDNSYYALDYLGKGLSKKKVFPLRGRKKRYDLFFYKDSLFNISVNGRFGGEAVASSNDFEFERFIGAQIFGNVSPYFSFYADICDYSSSTQLSNESYLNQRLGANYKRNNDFSEMRGGILASVKWGHLGIVKDNLRWGTSYNGSNIFSGRTPSFPMIKLHLEPVEWFTFDYVHAWLVSDVIDSAATYQSGNVEREIMRSKFLAANMFTVRPVKRLYISFGNSVVYSDRFNPVYLIPFLFYKSVDHTLNSTGAGNNLRGQNSQMFVNLVSRQIPFTQLYFSAYADEIRLSTMFNPREWRNHLSLKAGFRFTVPKVNNLSLLFEYTRNNPFVYRHFVSTTTFESNSYGLGHYLRDNAEQFYARISYKPISRVRLAIAYEYSRVGETYKYESGADGSGYPFLIKENLVRNRVHLSSSYLISHDFSIGLSYQFMSESGPLSGQLVSDVYGNANHTLNLRLMLGI